ncbi:MAG: hypothetical protein GY864_11485 [Desulfobacterales bacterium]|nr:hypothetical protein [Desulfobacterales bacterium]
MEALWSDVNSNNLLDQRWGKGLFVSVCFHLVFFSMIFFVPESIPTRRINNTVYEVNLVEMPIRGRRDPGPASKVIARKNPLVSKKDVPAKRISRPEKKEKPVIIAKRTVTRKNQGVEKPEVSPAKLIDQVLAKSEKSTEEEKKASIDNISRQEAQSAVETGPIGDRPAGGITIRIYQMEVENLIKSNWSYPVALVNPKSKRTLEAIMIVRVKNSGAIIKSRFKSRSSNAKFDQSVLRAIERSDPLPPFPPGYRKSFDDMEINFNLRDLIDN